MQKLLKSCLCSVLFCSWHVSADYNNVLHVLGVPKAEEQRDDSGNLVIPSVFSDFGAWHGHYLPDENDYYGSFPGPLIIAEEYSLALSDAIERPSIINKATGNYYLFANAVKTIEQRPGQLYQAFDFGEFKLEIQLIFVNDRQSLIDYRFINNQPEPIELLLSWSGKVFDSFKLSNMTALQNSINISFAKERQQWQKLMASAHYAINYSKPVVSIVTKPSYETKLADSFTLKANEEFSVATLHSYFHTETELAQYQQNTAKIFDSQKQIYAENKKRWSNYIDLALANNSYPTVALKSVETLIANWRSPAGAFLHQGVTPSITYKWFNGVWAWDSWKQAVALSYFAPELAKENIRSLFAYQIKATDTLRPQDAGMIIDAVFYNKSGQRGGDGGNWNERNSKPPLASWAVWQVYQQTGDISFVEELFQDLINYHQWWYTNRDFNQNGVAEYGATVDELNNDKKSQLLAAAWESGMDNAPRFDLSDAITIHPNYKKTSKVLKSKDEKAGASQQEPTQETLVGYSINQESVDLNSYLYQEKRLLAKMALLLNKKEIANSLTSQADSLQLFIQQHMFDETSGYFYDLRYDVDGKTTLLTGLGKGIEGSIALWAEVATNEQAERVVKNLTDSQIFNTHMPLPTVAKDNSLYQPEKYWRGPVWLDQAYFAIQGMKLYGFESQASKLAKKLLENGEGVLEKGQPLRENYHPETGQGLHCTNFSWTASVFFLLQRDLVNAN